ncbi:MAG TPA: DUF1476 domain-containing protein [Acetobacteraceae bacterium]|nr:DUF1476 domain-containing protein [Acetobacteraceae bacterium]
MMTFEERERAFEAKYAHDEEFRFRVTARRDKLFAHWGAEQLGLTPEEEAALLKSVLAVSDGPGHDDRVLELMHRAFLEHGGNAKLGGLALALQQCADQAKQQLLEHPSPLLI